MSNKMEIVMRRMKEENIPEFSMSQKQLARLHEIMKEVFDGEAVSIQWDKYIRDYLDGCIRKDMKKRETVQVFSDFLDNHSVQYERKGYCFIIEGTFFELIFNANGLFRGYRSGEYEG